MNVDLNCDLGEGEPCRRTKALLQCVTSANIACGGHAGDYDSMQFAVRTAAQHGVKIGAHPGFADRANFGRVPLSITPAELKTLLLCQVSALEKITVSHAVPLHHIKLHGALYHLVEGRRSLRHAFIDIVKSFFPDTLVIGLAGGRVARDAKAAGLKIWEEGFLDRGYRSARKLIPRDEPGAVLNHGEFLRRVLAIREHGALFHDSSAGSLQVRAQTWCIHADSRDALRFARLAAKHLFS